MTLRARLTAAFLAIAVGPLLVGAVFVGTTVHAVSRGRAVDRLDSAAGNLRTTMSAFCQGYRAAAGSAAMASQGGHTPTAIDAFATSAQATGVRLTAANGRIVRQTGDLPQPWGDCVSGDRVPGARSVVATVEMRDSTGAFLGTVAVGRRLDDDWVRSLALAGGVGVTTLTDQTLSSLPRDERDDVRAGAAALAGDSVGTSRAGRFVRLLPVGAGQPVPLALSTDPPDESGLYLGLFGVLLVAGAAAVLAAWWLARSTTRPVVELALAADRVAAGELDTRVPVHGRDEVGRLGASFNRMTREMRAYVQALTASRDQLRGNLGILGETLSSTHDLDRILQVILQTAVAATGARAGLVLLTDPWEPAVLVGRSAEGLPDPGPAGIRVPGGIRIPVGAGLLGSVARLREARRGRLQYEDPQLHPAEPHGRTYVAVPFADVGDGSDQVPRVLGVLALYDRLGQDEFDEQDLVTLRTFAGQAAVAVENVLLHEDAKRLSLTDPLTGLSNYRYLRESLRREVQRAGRFGRPLSVLTIDVDRFKEINDSYGHGAGDTVLIEVARRMRRVIRDVDAAFRHGGEEFVILLPETEAKGAATAAQHLRAAVAESPVRLDADVSLPLTVSVGIAVYPEHGDTDEAVLEAAEDALYAAKAAGRDTYRLAGPVSGQPPRDGASGQRRPPGPRAGR